MILAWPILVVLAVVLASRHRTEQGGRGWRWSLGWIAAGFLMSFSLITGFSIGLLLLPVAAVALLWMARRSPHLPEAIGFVAGIGATVALVVALNA
jgi:4-amino-4-deoxy-L-arabinose transferase-like glycosyltransferase